MKKCGLNVRRSVLMHMSPEKGLNSEMTQAKKDKLADNLVMGQFMFARELAKVLNRGQELEQIEKVIIKETIK